MNVQRLNDAPVLDQVQEHWQKLMAVILWKYHKGETLTLTTADFQAYQRDFDAGNAIMFTHGHIDSIDLAIISAERAAAIAEHEKTQRGTA